MDTDIIERARAVFAMVGAEVMYEIDGKPGDTSRRLLGVRVQRDHAGQQTLWAVLAYDGNILYAPIREGSRVEQIPSDRTEARIGMPTEMVNALPLLGRYVRIKTARGRHDGVWVFSGMECRFGLDVYRFSIWGHEILSLPSADLLSMTEDATFQER